jgi:hypothetical protein
MSDEKSTAGAPTLRERLKDGAPVVPVTEKPVAKSKAIPAWMRKYAAGASGVDSDGQVLKPSNEQRGVAGQLGSLSPRGPRV